MNVRTIAIVLGAVVLATPAGLLGQGAQSQGTDQNMRVILLGTQGGPTFDAQRIGISTLVLAGSKGVFSMPAVARRPAWRELRSIPPTCRECS